MAKVKPYVRDVFSYEISQLGIVHHSNYFRWMEEAWTDYLTKVGLDSSMIKKLDIVMPVLGTEAEFMRMFYYGDQAIISTQILEYNGVKMTVGYEIQSKTTGRIHCRGITRHCFLSEDGNPLLLRTSRPALHELLTIRLNEDQA